VAAPSLTDLVRAEVEQTAAALLKPASASSEEATAAALEELARQSEAMRGYLSEAQALVGAARAATDRFARLKTVEGEEREEAGGKLEQEVASLLEANARLTHLLRGVCLDIQRLFRRLAPSSSSTSQQQQQQRYGSPLRASGISSPAAGTARPSPYHPSSPAHQPRHQRSRTVLFGSPVPAAATSSASVSVGLGCSSPSRVGISRAVGAAGPLSPGGHHRSLAASNGSQQQRVEELLLRTSNGGLNSAESSFGGSGSGHSFGLNGRGQGVFNLQKIQNDLQEIQAKLTSGYKAGVEQASPLKPRQQGGAAATAAAAASSTPAATRLME
jgi:hypothetical protein